MRLTENLVPFLSGSQISTALAIPIRRHPRVDRVSKLVEIVRNKRVIDLGFADHLSEMDRKVREGTWLHAILANAADVCIGVDLEESAVAHARTLGYSNVVAGDISRDVIPAIDSYSWDFIIMGELVEHLDNPQMFLERVRQVHGSRVARVVITVPNAWSIRNIINSVGGLEVVNSDHRFVFTPYTIVKVLVKSGFVPEDLWLCDSEMPAPRSIMQRGRRLIRNFLLDLVPLWRPHIVVTARS